MNKVSVLFLMMLLCATTICVAQKKFNAKKDTVNTAGDTTSVLVPFQPLSKQPKQKIYHPDSTHSPHKAIIKSLIVPGLGQIYNRQYWKLPLVYGGFGIFAYSFIYAETNYKKYLTQVVALERGDKGDTTEFGTLTPAQLTPYVDFYHRNRDLTIILTAGFWAIQAIDAYVTAKFQHSYTMDNNLSFKLRPTIIRAPAYAYAGYIPGLRLSVNLR